jgi:UDP-N-acetyl-2-amino-2-deoxyglucuronate dehydrogenase
MLQWIFGEVQENIVHVHAHDRAAGYLEFDKARVRWFLSINAETLPEDIKRQGQRTFRSLMIGEDQFEFSGGFTELHTRSYEEILNGNGFRLLVAKPAIQIVHDIRNQTPLGLKGSYHPFAALPLKNHPFER